MAWAVADFESRFHRPPEGLWLSEAAVDTPTLSVLADYGVKYTILAPRQARAVSDVSGGNWRQVAEWEVDIREPYRVDLPGGKSIAVFFYNGPISQAVAFEGLLADGERFWNRLSGASTPGLLSLATDGETYGHHFAFGEMALAHVLAQAVAGRDGVSLTNFGAYLAANPPRRRALLQEESSWSCVHGVERWRADCGCTTGGGPGWNQRWRKPLREGLDALKKDLDKHYAAKGQALFRDPGKAFVGYGPGALRAPGPGRIRGRPISSPSSPPAQTETAWKLLAMQKWGPGLLCQLRLVLRGHRPHRAAQRHDLCPAGHGAGGQDRGRGTWSLPLPNGWPEPGPTTRPWARARTSGPGGSSAARKPRTRSRSRPCSPWPAARPCPTRARAPRWTGPG